jgi:two-component system response regulator HydG
MQEEKTKILVVDDETEVVDTLSSFLSRKGYEVNGASSGEEALSILEKESSDLILLDIRLPGMQGTEVARIIKEKYPSIKIIVVTAYSDESQTLYEDNLLEGLIIKPVKLQELYNKLLEILQRKECPLLNAIASNDIRKAVLLVKVRALLIIINLLFQDSKDN